MRLSISFVLVWVQHHLALLALTHQVYAIWEMGLEIFGQQLLTALVGTVPFARGALVLVL